MLMCLIDSVQPTKNLDVEDVCAKQKCGHASTDFKHRNVSVFINDPCA